ncbi:AAA family ATPase [Rhodopseudomonas palustris]|uniref:ATP-dependent DNA helicase n=1 Tax=Rhodopseudomonas palustris TaxID=1076 RepID=UPI0022F11A62|nr:AAA family ATPase [Rhodopseudomonas palustris]WBU27523.1 AAA family ATPase [Rhodopseudomonas palustris]
MTWSAQQEKALKAARAWYRKKNGPQVFRLFGFAGTGKTTLSREIEAIVRERGADKKGDVLYGAFTGKASLVMRQKGCRGASTIHSMIYRLDEETAGIPQFVLNEHSDVRDAKLVIIDECSMVGAELAHDLLSFGTKVLVLGDPAQLPPVKDAGYFTNAAPDFMLTEVHRQARDNPIIRISMDIREGRELEVGDHGACKVIPRGQLDPQKAISTDMLLVGKNQTRTSCNRRHRELNKIDSPIPVPGERLVCLKNDRALHLFNGGIWSTVEIKKANAAAVRMIVAPEDAGDTARSAEVTVHPYFFEGREGELSHDELLGFQQFTFGYALTVHKSQGSQWNDVVLFDESAVFRQERSRWLYTGVTRAAETLTVVV